MSGMGGMSGMGTLGLPFLAFIFALLLIGYSIWDLDQLSGPGASGHYSLAAARPVPAGAVLAGVAAMAGAGPGSAARPRPAAPRPRRGCRVGRGQPGPARRAPGPRPGGRHGPGPPRPVGGTRMPDRDGRHHGVHAADHDLARPPVRAACGPPATR